MMLTKADARVFLSNIVTLLVGKEHVSGKTTLWRVGIYRSCQLTVERLKEGLTDLSSFSLLRPRRLWRPWSYGWLSL